MPGAAFFMAIGGIGVSLAGFAGLITALDRRPDAHSPVSAWRIRNIVMGGFILTVVGFSSIALYTMTQENTELTVQITSLLMAVLTALKTWAENRPGPAWPARRGRLAATGTQLLLVVGYVSNAVMGRLGFLQLLIIFSLLDPLSIFFNTVRDVAQASPGGDEADA